MGYGAEESWAHIEALRVRVRSICRAAHPDELASLDAEFRELREQVWTALKASGRVAAMSEQSAS